MAVLCGMPTFSSKGSAICAQAVYLLTSLVSRDSVVDGDWLPSTE